MVLHSDISLTYPEWLALPRELRTADLLPRLAGADDGDGADESGTGGGDAEVETEKDEQGSSASGTDDKADDGDDDDGESHALKAENETLRRAVAAAEKEKRKQQRRQEEEKRARREEEGEYETLYKQAVADKDELINRVKNAALRSAIESQASKMKFHNPAAAARLVDVDVEVAVDDDFDVDHKAVERAVKKALTENPWLAPEQKGQSAKAGKGDRTTNGSDRPLVTIETAEGAKTANLDPRSRLRSAYETRQQ
jgi:hypothetical protein